jgi:nitrile hydratase accessory protein
MSTSGMITLSRPDPNLAAHKLDELESMPRQEGEPVFAEPWQAQAFALAVELAKQGHVTWQDWAAMLADEIQSADSRGERDDGSRYYQHWLAALERVVTSKGLCDDKALRARKLAWEDAYRATPHGRPVELSEELAHPGVSST